MKAVTVFHIPPGAAAILLAIGSAMLAGAPLHAEAKSRKAPPARSPTPTVQGISPKVTRNFDFQGDDLSAVLRTLAQAGRLNMVVGHEVTGTVNMRIEDKTPRESIEILAEAHELKLVEKKGILYLTPKNPPPPAPPKAPEPEKAMGEILAEIWTPTLMKFFDGVLDYQARPETAQKIARAKKVLYDALLAEGFAKEDALRIILSNQEFKVPGVSK